MQYIDLQNKIYVKKLGELTYGKNVRHSENTKLK